MNAYRWEDYVRRVEPYVPGEQPSDENIIKLNTNENPYGVSERVKSIARELDYDMLRKYPDPKADMLVSAISDYYGVAKDEVFVGVGSDDVLAMCFMTFFGSGRRILFPDITYSFYPVWARLLGIPFEEVPLREDYTISPEDYGVENGGIVIPNPNAPTGILLARDQIESILINNQNSIVIIDEAYIDFAGAGASVIDMINKYSNLIVVRTFSKSRSMAGIRIGYAISNNRIIKYLNDVKYSYNSYTMNYPSIILGAEAIRDEAYFRDVTEKIVKTREEFTDRLAHLGYKVLPSAANFVFASPGDGTAREIFEAARNDGIYFRYFDSPGIDDYLRITIGLPEDMDKVIKFLTIHKSIVK